jgi:hypothetical protein
MVTEMKFHDCALGGGTTVDGVISDGVDVEVALNGICRNCHGTIDTYIYRNWISAEAAQMVRELDKNVRVSNKTLLVLRTASTCLRFTSCNIPLTRGAGMLGTIAWSTDSLSTTMLVSGLAGRGGRLLGVSAMASEDRVFLRGEGDSSGGFFKNLETSDRSFAGVDS